MGVQAGGTLTSILKRNMRSSSIRGMVGVHRNFAKPTFIRKRGGGWM